jgi:hypothetical protein
MRLLKVALLVSVIAVLAPSTALAERCPNGRSADGAMWFSILHPGLGEYFLKGWGPFRNAPPKKFWLGFIPFFGWPGYLQVVSATDARHCRTNDWNG